MNLRSALALVALLLMPLSGCVFVENTHRNPGDATFLWTFQGQTCAMVPAVANVKIIIPGQTLMNDGVYDCSTKGTAGIVLHDFKGGLYSYTFDPRFNETLDNDPGKGESYYYVRVMQLDRNLAWSSPIWVKYMGN